MLEIDFATIVFQIINFLVLVIALYFLLFKKIIKQTETRKQEAEAMRQEELENLEESKRLRAEADAYYNNIEQKIDEYVDKAKSEIELNRFQVLEKTKSDAEAIYKQRQEDAFRTQQQTIKKFQKDILDIIIDVSLQTLELTTPDEIHHMLVKQMNERVWDLGKTEMRRVENIRKSLANREPKLAVETAKPLTKEEKALVIRTFSALADKNVKLELKIDESLVSGLRVRLGDFIVDNSLSKKLQEISDITLKKLSEKMEQLDSV
jgi:F-type H+-transporting ATPase subunit b